MKYYYSTLAKSIHGKFIINIPIDYDFFGSGIIFPPRLKGTLWGHHNITFYFNSGEKNLGELYGLPQQTIHRYIKMGRLLGKKFQSGSYREIDIWGYSPTKDRAKENNLSFPQEKTT